MEKILLRKEFDKSCERLNTADELQNEFVNLFW